MPDNVPHLSIEELDASIKTLTVMREMVSDPELEAAFRIVLTQIHAVTRNARDINDGN